MILAEQDLNEFVLLGTLSYQGIGLKDDDGDVWRMYSDE